MKTISTTIEVPAPKTTKWDTSPLFEGVDKFEDELRPEIFIEKSDGH